MCFERTPAVILVFLSLLSATVDGMMYVGVILLFLCTNCTSTYKLYVYTTYKYMVQGNLFVVYVAYPPLPPGVILFDQLTQEVAWRQPSISC